MGKFREKVVVALRELRDLHGHLLARVEAQAHLERRVTTVEARVGLLEAEAGRKKATPAALGSQDAPSSAGWRPSALCNWRTLDSVSSSEAHVPCSHPDRKACLRTAVAADGHSWDLCTCPACHAEPNATQPVGIVPQELAASLLGIEESSWPAIVDGLSVELLEKVAHFLNQHPRGFAKGIPELRRVAPLRRLIAERIHAARRPRAHTVTEDAVAHVLHVEHVQPSVVAPVTVHAVMSAEVAERVFAEARGETPPATQPIARVMLQVEPHPIVLGQSRVSGDGEVVRLNQRVRDRPASYELQAVLGEQPAPVPDGYFEEEILARYPIALRGNVLNADLLSPADRQLRRPEPPEPPPPDPVDQQCRANKDGSVIRVRKDGERWRAIGVVGKEPPAYPLETAAVVRVWPIALAEPVLRETQFNPSERLSLTSFKMGSSPSDPDRDGGDKAP